MEQKSTTGMKEDQHDVIIKYQNHHTRYITYTLPNTNATNHHKEVPKSLKHISIRQNRGDKSDHTLANLIHEVEQVTVTTSNLRKHFDQIFKLK